MDRAAHRRWFLTFLASSPLLASGVPEWLAGFAEAADAQDDRPKRAPITSPNEALNDLNVFEFEPAARQKLPPAHFGYLATGVDDDATLRANRTGFSRFQIRTRRLVDVSKVDTSTELFGTTWKTLVGPADPERRRLIARMTEDRQRGRQAVRGGSVRHGETAEPGIFSRQREVRRRDRRVHLIDRNRRGLRRRRQAHEHSRRSFIMAAPASAGGCGSSARGGPPSRRSRPRQPAASGS